MVPKEGTDLWVDTMVVIAASENKEAAYKFIDFMLDAENGAWVARTSSTRCRTRRPWKPSTRRCSQQYPNLAMPPADLVKFEQLRDVGAAQKAYSRAVSEIMAAK